MFVLKAPFPLVKEENLFPLPPYIYFPQFPKLQPEHEYQYSRGNFPRKITFAPGDKKEYHLAAGACQLQEEITIVE